MSHRVSEKWMGEQIETLEDLLRPGLHAVCIGINPARCRAYEDTDLGLTAIRSAGMEDVDVRLLTTVN